MVEDESMILDELQHQDESLDEQQKQTKYKKMMSLIQPKSTIIRSEEVESPDASKRTLGLLKKSSTNVMGSNPKQKEAQDNYEDLQRVIVEGKM